MWGSAMPDDNLYEVQLRDGQRYDVRTPQHHDDHDDPGWRKHLADILKGTVSGVTSTLITRWVFKGRAPRR